MTDFIYNIKKSPLCNKKMSYISESITGNKKYVLKDLNTVIKELFKNPGKPLAIPNISNNKLFEISDSINSVEILNGKKNGIEVICIDENKTKLKWENDIIVKIIKDKCNIIDFNSITYIKKNAIIEYKNKLSENSKKKNSKDSIKKNSKDIIIYCK